MENMLGNSFCAADKKLSTRIVTFTLLWLHRNLMWPYQQSDPLLECIDAPKDHRIISMMKKNNFTPSKQVKKTLVMVWVSGWVS